MSVLEYTRPFHPVSAFDGRMVWTEAHTTTQAAEVLLFLGNLKGFWIHLDRPHYW